MSTREERLAAGRAVFVRLVLDDAKAVDKACRDLNEPGMAPNERIPGELPDGATIGAVRRTRPTRKVLITDETALLAWVQEHRPDQIMPAIRPAFLDALRLSCKEHGMPVDKSTGEVIPGMELVEGSPSYYVDVDPAAVPMLRAKFAELIAGGLLELPSAEERAS